MKLSGCKEGVMQMFIEWSSSTHHTAVLIPSTLKMEHGFRSVYMFDEQQKEYIESQGDMTKLDSLSVYSDTLFIDIDSTKEDCDKCRAELEHRGLNYEIWESGSKGFHFHIPLIKTYQHIDLPAIHRQFVKQLSAGRFAIDESIYRHAGLFRLPGTRHKKTGKRKILMEKVDDKSNLELDTTIVVQKKTVITTSAPSPVVALNDCLFRMCNPPQNGNRYMSLWGLAKSLQAAAFSREFAEELLIEVNFSWPEPKDLCEIHRALGEAYD